MTDLNKDPSEEAGKTPLQKEEGIVGNGTQDIFTTLLGNSNNTDLRQAIQGLFEKWTPLLGDIDNVDALRQAIQGLVERWSALTDKDRRDALTIFRHILVMSDSESQDNFNIKVQQLIEGKLSKNDFPHYFAKALLLPNWYPEYEKRFNERYEAYEKIPLTDDAKRKSEAKDIVLFEINMIKEIFKNEEYRHLYTDARVADLSLSVHKYMEKIGAVPVWGRPAPSRIELGTERI